MPIYWRISSDGTIRARKTDLSGVTEFNSRQPKHLAQNKVLPFSRNVTFFVGENGTGKSTLIEAIAVAYGFNPEGGTRNFNFSTNQSHSDLWKHLVVAKRDFAKDGFFLRAESFYNVASHIEKSVEYQDTSHYQVSRRFLDDPDRMLKYLLDDKETR